MIPKSACPLWLADIRSDPCRKARPSAVSYTTPVDTIPAQSPLKSQRKQEALDKLERAIRETTIYIKHGDGSDMSREWEISRLWSEASNAIADFDPHLARRCFIKGQGWLDSSVWLQHEFERLKISDMRGGYIGFQQTPVIDVPPWFQVAGAGFAFLTFCSLFYLLIGPDLTANKRIIFDAWMAFCVASSAAFLGGTAVAKGALKIPFLKDAPVKFSAIGGIAVFVVVFLIMAAAYH
ncbi:hypothetical protein [Rhizobium ruizarguesonis]|uniref:hypothetical protein n=1 Tax=Rhizobium ruizarguesonis TaxID=2081791 RepID=UPI001030C806|nr:hypothetical protein [Rhizobium ruizarguesonis]TBA11049.1 hypothetical protein ELH65_31800 [Rhizobium ruizarguesonis]